MKKVCIVMTGPQKQKNDAFVCVTGSQWNWIIILMLLLVYSTINYKGLSQDLETGCPKLAIVKFLGVQIFKEDHNVFRFKP